MRLLLLATLLAVPVSAQTVEAPPVIPLPDSTAAPEAEPLPALTTADLLGESDAPALRPYGSLGVQGGVSGTVGALGVATGRLGIETPSGLRLGAVGVAATLGRASSFAVGPEVSLTRDLGRGVTLRARGQGTVGVTNSTAYYQRDYASKRLSVGGVLEVEREVPIVGSLRLVPRVGVFGSVSRFSPVPELGFAAKTRDSKGVHFGADARFRLFERDVSLSMVLPIPIQSGYYNFDGLGQPIGGITFGLQF